MLFDQPRDIVVARTLDEVRPALDKIQSLVRSGWWCAGFINYDAGYALEPRLIPRWRPAANGSPLLWFAQFGPPARLRPDQIDALLSEAPGAILDVQPTVSEAAYHERVQRALDYIAAGDIYQINLTFQSMLELQGTPPGVYKRLRRAQAAPHGALLHTGSTWALSFSPELFFALADGEITARPMKGTATRHDDPALDRSAALALSQDAKNRAENLMIVDLLRNDISRISLPGTVQVTDLFHIETYPTVHQMTSTVIGTLGPDLDAIDVLCTLFPCGSITGAPKIRAMELIADLEPTMRGLYTGSIGWCSPEGQAEFNVAIRTVVFDSERASLGLGSGIVADSNPKLEWEECLAKAAFTRGSI